MKITEQSASQLVLKSSGVIGMIVGVFLVLIGAILLYLNFAPSSTTHAGIWIPAGIIAVGILVFLFSKSDTITFDKDQKMMTFAKSGITGKSSKQYSLDDIVGVEIVEEYRTQTIREGNGNSVTRPERYERLSLVMKDGGRVAINSAQAGSGMAMGGISLGPDRETGMAQQIATFLGVPFNRVAPGMMPPGANLPPTIQL
jgi:hypothetical protein